MQSRPHSAFHGGLNRKYCCGWIEWHPALPPAFLSSQAPSICAWPGRDGRSTPPCSAPESSICPGHLFTLGWCKSGRVRYDHKHFPLSPTSCPCLRDKTYFRCSAVGNVVIDSLHSKECGGDTHVFTSVTLKCSSFRYL